MRVPLLSQLFFEGCISGVLGTFILLCVHHRHPFPGSFHLKKLKLSPLHTNPIPPSPSPWEPPFYFLSLWAWRLQEPHRSEILWHLSFCDWLLSLSMKSSRLIHVAEGVRMSFLLRLKILIGVDAPRGGYPCICQWTLGCFHLLALVTKAAKNVGGQRSVLNHCFQFFRV